MPKPIGHRLTAVEAASICQLLEDTGKDQKGIAEKIGISDSYFSDILGQKKNLTPAVAASLYKALRRAPEVSFLENYQRPASPEDQQWLSLFDQASSALRASYQRQDIMTRAACLEGLRVLTGYLEKQSVK